MSKTLPELVDAIQLQFGEGPPNGWRLGWSAARLQCELAELVHPGRLQNCTSFDYAFCNHFEIREGHAAEYYYVLTIRISFVQDLYCLHWTRYERTGAK